MLHFSSFPGKLSDIKSTWSSGPASHTQASLSHELWKVPRNTAAPTRPPPGLTTPKPSSTWGASPLGWTSSYSSGMHQFSCSDGVGWRGWGFLPALLTCREYAYRFVLQLLCKDSWTLGELRRGPRRPSVSGRWLPSTPAASVLSINPR